MMFSKERFDGAQLVVSGKPPTSSRNRELVLVDPGERYNRWSPVALPVDSLLVAPFHT